MPKKAIVTPPVARIRELHVRVREYTQALERIVTLLDSMRNPTAVPEPKRRRRK